MHLKSRTLLRCISFFRVKGSSGKAPLPKSCAVSFKGERGNGVDQRVVAVGWKPDGVRGPDTGFDCISMRGCGEKLTAFLSELFSEDTLPKTVLYSLDPTQNALLDTVIGCFRGTEAVGKLQHGAAWWCNDTKAGMKEQLRALADLSLLGNFIGMLTDSRRFLSYTRHEYFRRILCDLLRQRLTLFRRAKMREKDNISTLYKVSKNIGRSNARSGFPLRAFCCKKRPWCFQKRCLMKG